MFTVAIVAVVVVLGGLIAFIGDHIGRRIGRKKLTLFGLRPKHTSVVVTILTGIVIAGGTLAALTALSEDVRTAIFHIREIRRPWPPARRSSTPWRSSWRPSAAGPSSWRWRSRGRPGSSTSSTPT